MAGRAPGAVTQPPRVDRRRDVGRDVGPGDGWAAVSRMSRFVAGVVEGPACGPTALSWQAPWVCGVTDDRELFLRWAGGDRDAGQQLVVRHYDAVYFFFASKVSDEAAVELTQHTFEIVCKQASSLRIHSSFASYLFGIARWRLVDHFRGQSGQGFDPLADSFPEPTTASSITAWLGHERADSTLIQTLRQLPLDDQLLLELRLYEGLQLREIAEILGLAREQVATRLVQAKRRLLRAAGGLGQAEDTLTTLSSYMRGVRAQLARNLEEAADGGER